MLKLHHKITAGCLVCFFLLWSVRIPLVVHASSSLPGVYTQESIGSVFEDSTLQAKLNNILLTNQQVDSDYNLWASLSLASFSFDTSKLCFATFNSGGGFGVSAIDVPDGVDFIYYTAGSGPRSGYFYCINDNSSQDVSGRTPITGHVYLNSGSESTISQVMVAYYPWGSGQQGQLIGDAVLLYSPVPVVSQDEAVSAGAPSSGGSLYNWLLANYQDLTDVRGSGAVWDGSEIVDPSEPDTPVESIDNHLYAKTFDVDFCMNPNVWNGNVSLAEGNFGNFYFSYTLDNYAFMNVSDLSLYVDSTVVSPEGNFTDSYSFSVDGDGFMTFSNNFIVSNYTWLLDPSLFTVIYDSTLPEGFKRMQLLSGLTVEKLQSSYSRQLGEGRVRMIYNSSGEYIGSASDYPTELVTYPDDFTITFDCYFVSKTTSETSQHFTKTFDLVHGSSIVSDNGIFDNVNPFDGSSNINEVVPFEGSSGALSGAGNIVQTVSFPSRIEIVDESYIKVAELYSQDAQTVQNGFWAMMGYFADNPMIETYSDMFDWMPPELLGYIGTCLGICFGFGVFRAIRGRG